MINKDNLSLEQYLDLFQAEVYTNEHISLPYRIFIPKTRKPKLLVFLHGSGERGNENRHHVYYTYDYAFFTLINNNDTIIIAPQCPDNCKWTNADWSKDSFSVDKTPISVEMQAVKELLDQIILKYDVDNNNIGVTGLSMGGFGTWDIISRFPYMFKYAVPICGAGDPSKADKLKNIDITIVHGLSDPAVPVNGSILMSKALESCNIKHTTHFLEGVKHNSWIWAYQQKDLFKQK